MTFLSTTIIQARSFDCQVCFTNAHALHQHQRLIRCRDCKRSAHQFCYSPNLNSSNFTCDACSMKFHGKCMLCSNSGLLKKFSAGFAHPLCLFFHQAIVVADFKTLSFDIAENIKPGKKVKCSFCENSIGTVIRCSSRKCPIGSHLYCAMKSQQVAEGKGWRVCLQALDSEKSFKQAIQNLLLRTLRHKNKFIAGQLSIKKSLKTLEMAVMMYCQQHSTIIVDCNCREYNEQKLDWLYCESCCRWIHWDCVKFSKEQRQKIQSSDDAYFCQECRNWQKWVRNKSSHIPQFLPKLHIYDYVYINREIELLGSAAPSKLVELAERIPLLPGLGYGSIFFKPQLVKKLKSKINVNGLYELLECRKNVSKAIFQHKDEFQMIQWINSNNFIGQGQQQKLAHPLEDSLDSQYVEEMLKALQKYENTHYGFRANSNAAKKKKGGNRKRPTQESEGRSSRNTSKHSKSITPTKAKLKVEMQEDSQFRSRIYNDQIIQPPKAEPANYEEINEYLQSLLEKFKTQQQRKVDLVEYFEGIFKVIKKAQIVRVLKDQPKNTFIRCILMQTPKHAAVYASYVGKMECIYRDVMALRRQDKRKMTPQSYKDLQRGLDNWRKLKYMIYQSQHALDLQQALFQQATILELRGNLRQCLLQHGHQGNSMNQNEAGNEGGNKESFQWMSLKSVQRIVLKQQDKGQFCPNTQLLYAILQQQKEVKFTNPSKQALARQVQILQKDGTKDTNLIFLLKQFLKLFEVITQLLKQLKIPQQDNKFCFFQLLSRQLEPIKTYNNKQELCYIVTFLSKIQKIKLNIFSRLVQQTVIALVKIVLQHFQGNKLAREEELIVVSYWSKLLRIPIQPQLDKLIRLDQSLYQRYFFEQLSFQRPEEIARLKVKLEQDLPKYQELNLQFRVRKIVTLLDWIRIYQSILEKTTLQSILTLQIQSENANKRPKFEQVLALDNTMNLVNFPDSKFRNKFKEMVNIAKQIKLIFDKIMACCDWQFVFQTSQHNWDNKVEIAQVLQFIAVAKKLPVCLQIEAIECEIIIDRFQQNESRAVMRLRDISSSSSNCISKQMQQKIIEVINHFGANPIKSEYTDKLLNVIENLENPNKMQEKAQKMYQHIASSPQFFSYEEVCWLIKYLHTDYQGILDKNKVLLNLNSIVAIVEDCLHDFKDIVEKYKSGKQCCTDVQLIKLAYLSKKYNKSTIRHLLLKKICLDFEMYQELSIIFIHFDENHTPIQAKSTQEMEEIKKTISCLHPYFHNEKVQNLKLLIADLQQLKKKQ